MILHSSQIEELMSRLRREPRTKCKMTLTMAFLVPHRAPDGSEGQRIINVRATAPSEQMHFGWDIELAEGEVLK